MNTQTDPRETAAEPLKFTLVGNGDRSTISIFLPGETPVIATGEHPNFEKLRDGAVEGTITAEEAKRLADLSVEADLQFSRITDRVSVAGGHVYFDGDRVHSTLATQIVRFHQAGMKDYRPLVAFMEKLAQNPSDHSRNQLYDWLSKRDFTIAPDGDFIAYKGVRKDGEGNLVSITAGPAIVNGQSVNGHVPNPLGGVIEIARSYVDFNPSQGCSYGLHVGTYKYAHDFAQGALLKVTVNPRDVVSVPTECDWQKMRVCRYKVIEQIDAPETEPVDWSLVDDADYPDDDDFATYCDSCGDHDCDGECEGDKEGFQAKVDRKPIVAFDTPECEFPVPEFKVPSREATATAFTPAEEQKTESDEDRTPERETRNDGEEDYVYIDVLIVAEPEEDLAPELQPTPTATAFTTADPADHGEDEVRGHAV